MTLRFDEARRNCVDKSYIEPLQPSRANVVWEVGSLKIVTIEKRVPNKVQDQRNYKIEQSYWLLIVQG